MSEKLSLVAAVLLLASGAVAPEVADPALYRAVPQADDPPPEAGCGHGVGPEHECAFWSALWRNHPQSLLIYPRVFYSLPPETAGAE